MRWLSVIGLLLLSRSISSSDPDEEGEAIDQEADEDEVFYNKTYMEHLTTLQAKIFKDYNRNNRPVLKAETTVEVEIHVHVTHIAFNQKEQTMTVHGHMYMCWFDEFLGWDPKDYDNIAQTNVKKWQVWMPDVRVSNSINGIYSVHDIARNAHITVNAYSRDGKTYETKAKVETYPTFSMKVGCLMDFSDYPYDEHSCAVSVFTPKKMRQVKLRVYQNLKPTLFLSWTNDTKATEPKLTSGDFTIYQATNNISYYRFGEKDSDAPITGNGVAKTWSIYNMYVFYKRHSAYYFVTIALPLLTSTTISLMTLIIKDIQFATILNVVTFVIHALFISEFINICPVSVYLVPRAMMFHGFGVCLTIFCFCFQLFLWLMSGIPAAQAIMIDTYSKAYNFLPLNPYPGFMEEFVKGLGDIRTRGWNRNVTVWRTEAFCILTVVYSSLFASSFLL